MIEEERVIPDDAFCFNQNKEERQRKNCGNCCGKVMIFMENPEGNIGKQIKKYNNKKVPGIVFNFIPKNKGKQELFPGQGPSFYQIQYSKRQHCNIRI